MFFVTFVTANQILGISNIENLPYYCYLLDVTKNHLYKMFLFVQKSLS